MAVAAVAGAGMLLTLHLDGIQGYLATLLAPQPIGDTAKTLRSALHGGPAVLAIQAAVVLAVIAVALRVRRTRAAWPVIASAVAGSFLLATYWHPQDYLVLDAAAAIVLAAAPLEVGVLVAIAAAVVSALVSPLNSHQATAAWLLFAIALIGFLGVRSLMRLRPPVLNELQLRGSG